MGYTSLGGTTDTHRNPALRRQSTSGTGTPKFEFRPAYELIQDDEERLGRDWQRRRALPNSEKPLQSERPREAQTESAIADDDDDDELERTESI
jgi:hypothetical protein